MSRKAKKEPAPTIRGTPGPVELNVYGVPAPQGSKRHVGHGIMVESSKKVKPWREAVKAAYPIPGSGIVGACSVVVTFWVPAPKNAKAGDLPAKRPDLDKLLRSTMDALADVGAFEDDSRVVRMVAEKRYACAGRIPGAHIVVQEVSR